jgi:hypothetical protein
MAPPTNAPLATGHITRQHSARASPSTDGAWRWNRQGNTRRRPPRRSLLAHGEDGSPTSSPAPGDLPGGTTPRGRSPHDDGTPPTGGSRGGTPQTSGSPREGGTPQKSSFPQEGASSPSSAGTSPILLTDPTQVLGPSLHSMVVGDFADAHLADNPTATRIQAALEAHAATFDREFTPTNSAGSTTALTG